VRRLALLMLCAASSVAAHPRALPSTYFASTEPKGEVELEQFVDLIPTVARSGTSGEIVGYLSPLLTTEFEYGITDRFELGVYVTLTPQSGDAFASTPQAIGGNGGKLRLRWSLAEEGRWPVDVALYAELGANHRELELELKAIVERRLGPVRLALNLSGEREYYWAGQREWVLNPSAGATVQALDWLHLGLEYWLHVEFPDTAPPTTGFNLGPHHYVGPSVMVDFGRLWLAVAAYVRVSSFNHVMAPGDAYGVLWLRTALGVTL
jgi:hypothetical protein